MTKERREEIERDLCNMIGLASEWQDEPLLKMLADSIEASLTDVLADAQYWRDVVKSLSPRYDGEGEFYECVLCGHWAEQDANIEHAPGCPWKAGQE